MLNVVRRSQIIGWIAIDSSTNGRFGKVDEVWLDDSIPIAYFSDEEAYLPVYYPPLLNYPENLRRLHQINVESILGEPLGWVDDFLFDVPFDSRVEFYPEDFETIATDKVIIRKYFTSKPQSDAEGLKGFFSKKSQQIKNLVNTIGDRFHHKVARDDKPKVIRAKIITPPNHSQHFWQKQWHSLEKSISRATNRAKSILDTTWKRITN